MSAIPSNPEPELRALGSLRRQCLFAVTILLVEDSRSASEAIRLYAAESGARVRRADSLHAASRHLAIYRPNVVMVDLGLPDGDGMALIRHLASASTPIGAIVALSGHERGAWQARRCGRRRRLPGEADREPAGLPGVRALASCPTPRPGAGRTSASWRSPGGRRSRAALVEDMRRARALLAEALPAGTPRPSPTARSSSARSARCWGTRSRGRRARRRCRGRAGPLAALLARRLDGRRTGQRVPSVSRQGRHLRPASSAQCNLNIR